MEHENLLICSLCCAVFEKVGEKQYRYAQQLTGNKHVRSIIDGYGMAETSKRDC